MEVANVLERLVDLKFEERLAEVQRFIRDSPRFEGEPPDGGSPEPGTPPAGPARFEAPPDGGPPPEPGVPLPPEPGPIPPSPVPNRLSHQRGPDPRAWVTTRGSCNWSISIKAPTSLDVIDAHITRRLKRNEGTRRWDVGSRVASVMELYCRYTNVLGVAGRSQPVSPRPVQARAFHAFEDLTEPASILTGESRRSFTTTSLPTSQRGLEQEIRLRLPEGDHRSHDSSIRHWIVRNPAY